MINKGGKMEYHIYWGKTKGRRTVSAGGKTFYESKNATNYLKS